MLRSFAKVFTCDLIAKVLMGLAMLTIIRVMPIAQFAVYTVVLATVTLSTNIFVHAFNRILIVGGERMDLIKHLKPLAVLQSVLVCVATTVILFALNVDAIVFVSAIALSAALAFSSLIKTMYQRAEQFDRFGILELTRSVLFAGSLFGVMFFLDGTIKVWHAIGLQASAFLLAAVPAGLKFGWKTNNRVLAISRDILMQIAHSQYRYLFAYLVVLAMVLQTDIYMLRLMTNERTIAEYGSAFRYYSFLTMALGAVHTVMLPLVNNATSLESLNEIYRRHRNLIILITPGIVGLAIAATWLIPIIDGGRYTEAPLVFQILAVSSILSFALSPHVNLVMRYERFKFLFRIVCVAFAVNVCVNLVLIPKFGSVGAAIGTVTGFLLVNGAIYILATKLKSNLPRIRGEEQFCCKKKSAGALSPLKRCGGVSKSASE